MKKLIFLLFIVQLTAFAWWDLDWHYREKINLSASSPFTNFTTNFTFDTATPISAGRMNPDCSDIRVVWQNDTEIQLNHWLSRGCDQPDTLFFSKLSEASSNQTIYVYFGNPGESSISSVSNLD